MVIDTQNNYCIKAFCTDKADFEIKKLRKLIFYIKKILKATKNGKMEIIFTRHGSIKNTHLTSIKRSFF